MFRIHEHPNQLVVPWFKFFHSVVPIRSFLLIDDLHIHIRYSWYLIPQNKLNLLKNLWKNIYNFSSIKVVSKHKCEIQSNKNDFKFWCPSFVRTMTVNFWPTKTKQWLAAVLNFGWQPCWWQVKWRTTHDIVTRWKSIFVARETINLIMIHHSSGGRYTT